ncbi:ABC transporter permease [Sphingomonas sp.]|uniref:ABC transporter permease n=1 Tax=Sphingomonas sp. TaxID=28214 RepID=UPI002DEA01A2|nr:ABC transporter permease [Sphingomonas sp.]HEV2568179.1 ABC transporter permease [Sphingomonas sp.]
MTRLLRQALVIARRDFTAITLTPTFLIFLLAPLFMFAVATIGSLGAVQAIEGQRQSVLVLAAPDELARLRAAERELRSVVGADPGPPPVDFRSPRGVPVEEAHGELRRGEASAVLFGPPGDRSVVHIPAASRDATYLRLLASAATGEQPQVRASAAAPPTAARDHQGTAFGAVFLMFLLSLVLASQAISTLAEERNNKVIEILAAAVPLEAVFLGKLLGLLGVALVFSAFWSTVGLAAASSLGGAEQLDAIAPAIGLPAFAALFLGYFVLSFLLLGAVFLGVGAQAGTMREIQMLSLPVTIFQVAMFALASAGANAPHSTIGVTAAVFPFSSPFAMAARAAIGVPAWQHALAFAWQLLWLALTITVAARLFRRGVLKSGAGR